MFSEDDLLPLSGLQHLAFCERQWGLIHLEQMWEENRLTADGRVLHERVHKQTAETRHGLAIVRGLPIYSRRLGLSGQADVVEFSRAGMEKIPNTIQIPARDGWWLPRPIEYKRGKAKREACDRIQLCAQALCLEEMFGVEIPDGALFYGTNRRRTTVLFNEQLRTQTEQLAARMHELYINRVTPRARLIPGCESCSVQQRCLPNLPMRVERYYQRFLDDGAA